MTRLTFARHALPPALLEGATALVTLKETADRNDPARLQGIHGPMEESFLSRTGRMPESFYEAGDGQPWGLTMAESRSNILWQVVSGMMDREPDFAASYMALALDQSLSDDDYTYELKKLNRDWNCYLGRLGAQADHRHSSMAGIFHSVSCPACSVLTALACQDASANAMFREMLPLAARERRAYLEEKNLLPALMTMRPDIAPPPPGF